MKYKYQDLCNLVLKSKGLCTDSRKLQEGECFFALQGANYNANYFITKALDLGALFCVSDDASLSGPNVVIVDDVAQALGFCAKQFYQDLPDYKIAITGTNGKTSIANYSQQILTLLGQGAASLGTIGLVSTATLEPWVYDLASLTSNDLISNYKILSALKKADVNYVAMEASSIGIEQNRFNKIEFEAAAFSTFTQDHLDYHQSMENYMHAKLELFQEHMAPNAKVFISDLVYQSIVQMMGSNYLEQDYSIIGSADFCDVRIKSHKFDLSGQRVDFLFNGKDYHFTTSIVGGFQAYNMLFAITLVEHLGFDINDILKVVDKVICVKGRLEKIEHPFKHIFIDYAHNPDALESVLLELSELKPTGARIITVFGCGGDRDKGKRSTMGNIASRLSDFVIITDDNPRNEDPEQIRMQICSGIAKNNYKIIENRTNAIINALNLMNNYDILLIAGKGHEEYQIYNDKIIHFSDTEVVNQNIK